MRYFITGGAGFIGSHLVDRLIAQGHEVTVYDNFSSGKKEFIKQHFDNPKFKLIEADLLELEKLKEVIKGHDMVFHLAANPDAIKGMQDTELDLRIGTIATYNLLEAMRLNNIKKIVFTSSGTVYGDVGTTLTPESFGPLFPISLYGASKQASESLISAFCYQFGMQAWIFRFANIIGNRATHGVIYDFINKLKINPKELEILGDGKQSKQYLLVDECLDAIFFVLEKTNEKINLYNLGVDDYLDVNAIADIVVKEMNLKNVKYDYTGGDRGWAGDVPETRHDYTKINKLGWKAKHTSAEAVRESVRRLLGTS